MRGRNRGTGTFQAPISEPLGMIRTSIAVGDFNGDGKLDLAATSTFYYGFYYGNCSYAQVLFGDGSGDFAIPNSTWLGDGYFTAATTANLDGVGSDDLVAINSEYGYYYGIRDDLTIAG